MGEEVQDSRGRLRVIVLAGGSGRRLEPLVRRLTGRTTPKQFVRFDRSPTLLQRTLARVAPLADPALVVVDRSRRGIATEQAPHGTEVLAQPCDRGTGPGVLYPLLHVLAADPDADVLVTPSDHGIADDALFRAGVRRARAALHDQGLGIVLLGATADRPRTDYGWITPGARLGGGVRRVASFVEKPAAATARRLERDGALWSTMVLVARGRALLDAFETARPELTGRLRAVLSLPEPARTARLDAAYAEMPACDFSRDILAHASGLAVLAWPARVGWTDLGTPERLLDWLRPEEVAG